VRPPTHSQYWRGGERGCIARIWHAKKIKNNNNINNKEKKL
jgi:hypothetical protein